MSEKELTPSETWRQMSDFQRTNWLGTRIMGWHSDRDFTPGAEYVYWFDGRKRLMLLHEWQPLIQVDHTFLVACKLRDKGLYIKIVMRPKFSRSEHKWFCSLEDCRGCWYFEAEGNDLADVIGECAWLAYGQEHE